jgi:predicted dinucleotide-binding enzyme
MSCKVMVRPGLVRGEHVVFLSGDDHRAKQTVVRLLASLGRPQPRVIDLAGRQTARGTEAFLLMWLPIWRALGQGEFNIAIERTR